MSHHAPLSRRLILQAGAATTLLGAPGLLLAQPKPIKVGLLHPVSGALAYSGGQSRLGGQMAIDEINAAGGIKSMGGAKLEALLGDSQSRPEVGVSEVERMQQDGVSAYIGCFSSAIALPSTQAAAKYNTPFLIDVGVSDALVSRGLKNVFRLAPGNGKCVEDAFAGLSEVNKAAGGLAKTAGIGLEVKEALPHASPTRDFTNLVLRIKAIKPDIVIMSNYQNEYVLMARTIFQQKVDLAGMFSVLGGGFNYKFIKEQPDVAQYMMDFNHWYNPRNPKAIEMRKKVEAAGGLFTFEVYCTYNSVKLYASALEAAKSADKAAVIAALEASTWADHFMPYGPTKFVNGQNQGGRAALLQASKTDIDVVWPNEFAGTKPVFPRPKFS
jgi:branched-chain amino acid transport system substrate-binding protein